MPTPVQYHYSKFPPTNLIWAELIPFIGPANAALARYDGTLSAVPNANVLLSPLTTQEALLSSRIEGTQATMGEVLEYEAEGDRKGLTDERKKEDINEVLNYRHAMWAAIELLKELPLCQRIIKESHSVLLGGVRGHGKSPGEYRRIPNWIGPPGCSMEEASFVPISADKLNEGMSNWEKYINQTEPDPLVQLAIIHAEFEALHPFLDCNGRLGRMCVPLFMFNKKLIQSPMFYISAFFEANKEEYYNRLQTISRDDDWTGWCKFFLRAVTEQAKENQKKAAEILKLYEDQKAKIIELTHSQYAIHALDYIFSRPIFRATDFTGCKEIPRPTAQRILSILRDNNILRVLHESSGRRAAMYMFTDLMNTAEGKKIF